MGSSLRIRAAAVAVLAACLACGGPATPAGPDETRAAPAAVPLPEMGGLDPDVQATLRAEHAALAVAVTAGTATDADHGRLGMRFAAFGLVDAAEIAYRNAVTLAPDEFRWPYYLALLHREQSRLDEAIDGFEAALALRPDYVAGLANLGDAYLLQGRGDEARTRYDRALQLDPACSQCLVGLGRLALQLNQHQRAADALERALQLTPGAVALRYPLAQAYRALGRTEEAQAQLDARAEAVRNTGLGRAIDRPGVHDPLLAELRGLAVAGKVAYEARGVLAARAGRWTEALEQFDRMIAADPDDPVSRNLLATALLNMGRHEDARREYEETLRLDPTHAGANVQLGLVLAEEGHEEKAIEHFRRAVASDPGSNVAYLNLAAALLRHGDAPGAAEAYGALIERDPSNAPARLGRAMALIRAGRHAAARTQLEEDMRAQPGEVAFPHTLARLLAASPDDEVRDGPRALELLGPVTSAVRSPQVLESVAMAAAEVGAFDQAARSQRGAIEMAREAGQTALASRLEATLARYAQGHPVREPFHADDPVFSPAPFRPQAIFEERAP